MTPLRAALNMAIIMSCWPIIASSAWFCLVAPQPRAQILFFYPRHKETVKKLPENIKGGS